MTKLNGSTYQIERAHFDKDDWEQLAPTLDDPIEALALLEARRIESRHGANHHRFRCIRTTKEIFPPVPRDVLYPGPKTSKPIRDHERRSKT